MLKKQKKTHALSHSSDGSDEPAGLFQQFWVKVLGQNWENMIDLTSKSGEINDKEHNKDSKI